MFCVPHDRARADLTPPELSLRPPPELRSVSLRYPWKGSLVRGMRLAEDAVVRHVDDYAPYGRFYGTWQLVQLLRRAATRVESRFPGSQLSVGELSGERGGRIAGHNSHRNGRDVDIAFYMTNDAGAAATARNFVPFVRKSGVAYWAGGRVQLDDARNWALVSKLIDDDDARVQYVFVSKNVQRRLLAEAARVNAPEELLARAKTVMFEPRAGHLHQNHFHVRIYCPAEDRPQCADRPPYYPWYDGVPPGGPLGALMQAVPPQL